MKAVLMSIQPKWCQLIAAGEKTIEVRKSKPKLQTPFKVYIYCTKPTHRFSVGCGNYYFDDQLFKESGKIIYGCDFGGIFEPTVYYNGKVIGEFVCNKIEEWDSEFWNDDSVYQAISRIDYDDDGDYDWVNIASNEDDNPSNNYLCKESCLSFEKIQRYAGNGRFYAWRITDLVIYDKPKAISNYMKPCSTPYECEKCKELIQNFGCGRTILKPPQSWCYVEEVSKDE